MATPIATSQPRPPSRLLVRGVNWLGDAVMTTPALVRLKQRFPNTPLTLLTAEKLADLWRGHPAVDSVLTVAGENPWRIGRRLRAGGYSVALVFPNSPRSALEAWFAGVPERIGYARPWRNWLLTRAVSERPGAVRMRKRPAAEVRRLASEATAAPTALSPAAHHTHDYLHLAANLGADPTPIAPVLAVDAAEVEAARVKFSLSPSERFFGLNPGAEYGPAKRWPVDRFIAAAGEVRRRTGWRPMVFGGRGDVDIGAQLADGLATSAGPAAVNLAGRTSLRELMALLKCCQVVLTNDSGPMHVAAALGTRVVVPFGSTSPELTGPGLPGDARHRLLRGRAPCAPCFLRECPIDLRCLASIQVADVVEAVCGSCLP